jgi:hypothetical protein
MNKAQTYQRDATRPQAHAHVLVYETAVALAHELYDTLMQEPKYYAEWKRQNPARSSKQLEALFVARNAPKCLGTARATLAAMLHGPVDSPLKAAIHEALCLDATLIRGRGAQNVPRLQAEGDQ